MTGNLVAGGTCYWRLSYTRDAFNNAFDTDCADETAPVPFDFKQ